MKSQLSLLATIVTAFLIPASVFAFALSPSSLELTAKRGETIVSSITILNTQEVDTEYYIGLIGFRSKDDTGTPEFYTTETGSNELANWILFENDSFVVPALSASEVPFKVIVPDDVASQSYFAAITISPAPADVVASNGAIIEAKTASLVFLTVEGETQEQLVLLDFVSTDNSIDLPFRTYTYRLQNQGNVHVTPTGSIKLTGVLGQTISTIEANSTEGRVLPGSTRTFEIIQENPLTSWYETVAFQLSHLAFGPVTATLDLSYAKEGTIQSSISFWLFPWQFMVTLLGLLIALMILYQFLRRKRHN